MVYAPQVFRSLLKLSGGRNSRFPESFHSDNIISMCLGQPPKISDNYISSNLSGSSYNLDDQELLPPGNYLP